jgi:hypothetical protein
MTPDLSRILAGKLAYRQHLAALPIAEKLRMLESLRARSLEIAAARGKRREVDGSASQRLPA